MNGLVLMPVIMAVVLAVSAIAKLTSRGDIPSAFTALRIPHPLNHPAMHLALGISELVLAIGLLVLPGAWLTVTTVLTVVLMAVYVGVVGRALTFGYPVTCGCFGRIGMGLISRRTLLRNILLTITSLLAVWWSLSSSSSPVATIFSGGVEAASWVAAAMLASLVTYLITHSGTVEAAREVEDEGGELDYVRLPTPPAALLRGDGTRLNIRDMARRQACVLVFVSPGCGYCSQAVELVERLEGHLGHIALRTVVAMEPDNAQSLIDRGLMTTLDYTLFDPSRMATTALGTGASPSAVILGTDDYLAGGPVSSFSAVEDMINEIQSELEAAGQLD